MTDFYGAVLRLHLPLLLSVSVPYFLLFLLVLRTTRAERESPTLTVFNAPHCSGGSTGLSGILLVPRLDDGEPLATAPLML